MLRASIGSTDQHRHDRCDGDCRGVGDPVRTPVEDRPEQEVVEHLSVSPANLQQLERAGAHLWRPIDPRNRHFPDAAPHHQRLQTGLSIDRKMWLVEDQVLYHFTADQLQVVGQVAESPAQDQACKQVKATVRDDFLKRVVEQNTMAGETAADDDIESLVGGTEQIAHFRQEMPEITIHRKNPRATRRLVAGRNRSSDAIRRPPKYWPDARVPFGQRADDLGRPVRAIVVHKDDFTDVVTEQLPERRHQRLDVRLFVVTRDND